MSKDETEAAAAPKKRGPVPRTGARMYHAVNIRMSAEERGMLEVLADEHDMGLSELCRRKIFGIPLDD